MDKLIYIISIAVIIWNKAYFASGLCEAGRYFNDFNNVCTRCVKGSYIGEEVHDLDTCTQCPVNNETGIPGSTKTTGSTSIDECFYEPRIRDFHPKIGPIAGGTEIKVDLYAFEDIYNITFVYIGRTSADVIYLNKSEKTMTLLTREVDDKENGTLQLTFDLDRIYRTNESYYYLENPIIESIDKTTTFVSGGLTVGVRGMYLDHIHKPRLIISLVFNGRITTVYSQPCEVLLSTYMECLTPNLGPTLQENGISSNSRRRRTVEAQTLNDNDKQFYGGFDLDGVVEYRNITASLPDYGQFQIYLNPEYDKFEEDNFVGNYDVEDIYLYIEGERLDYACDESDVTVKIGQGYCNVTLLATNLLTCIPPQTQPEPEPFREGPGKLPMVIVLVGNLKFVIGFLDYSPEAQASSRDDNNSSYNLLPVIIGAAVGLALLLIIIITIMVINYRRKRSKHNASSNNLEARLSQHGNGRMKLNGRYVTGNSINHNPLVTQLSTNRSYNLPPIGDDGYGSMNRQRQMSDTVSAPRSPGPYDADHMIKAQNSYYENPDEKSVNLIDELEESLRLSVNECLIPCEHITMGDIIGTGHFGKVYKGMLCLKGNKENEEMVAIKVIQGTNHTVKEVGAFLEEASVMKDFDHENVLSLIGVAIQGSQPLVILPFMAHGDLKSYIRESTRMMKVKELLGFGKQIARGMAYLAKQKFIHRDLATRNCMLNDMFVVKIADFGLSRDVYKCDYYRVEDRHRPLPVRWMAVESLTSGVFSVKSDVWSFGVCMWELLTRGCSPYPDVDTFNIKQYVCSGRRLSQPEHAPDDVYELLTKCWVDSPEDRPDFNEIHDELEDILDTSGSDYATVVFVS